MKKSLIILFLILVAHTDAFGQWVQTNGPYGGGGFCFGKHNNALFAGNSDENYNARIFRSTDDGISWSQTKLDLPGVAITSIVSIGTNIFASSDSGISLSTDSGVSWNSSNSGLTNTEVTSLAVMGSNVFAGTEIDGLVFLSTDTGESWIAPGEGLISAVRTFGVIGSRLFAETYDGGLFQSTDSAKSWDSTNNGLDDTLFSAFAVIGSNLFAASNEGGIFASTDSGKSWSRKNSPPNRSISSFTGSDSNLFVGTYGGIFRSTDSGVTWLPSDSGIITNAVQSLMVTDSVLIVGMESTGIFRSTNNGVSWMNTGVPEFETTFLAAEGPNLYSNSYYEPIFVSGDGGKTWTSDTDAAATTMTAIGTTVFAGYNNNSNSVFISTDSGNSWTYSNPISTSYGVSSLTSIDSNLFALTDIGIFLSTDFGESWQNLSGSAGIDNHYNSNSWVSVMGAADSDLYAFGESSFLSTDLGSDWSIINVAVSPSLQFQVAAFTQCESYVFVVDRFEGMMRSTDHGSSWHSVNAGLPDSTAISSLASRDNYVFAGSVGRGIFISSNFGETWTAMNSGLTDTTIFSLAVKDSILYAGTGSSGVWRYSLSDLPTLSYILDVKNTENDTIFFDTIPVGGTSLRTVTEFNAGNGQLTIQPIQAPQNDFTTSDLSSSVILDSGESFPFEVYFQPTTPGLHLAELNLLSEAREVTIYLSGFASGQGDVNNSNLQSDLLLSTFPNPLSQSTTIRFTSAESGVARVTVVNLLGEEVARVFEGALTAGKHSFVWSKPTGLPAGMYECIVEMNGSTQQVPVVVTQ